MTLVLSQGEPNDSRRPGEPGKQYFSGSELDILPMDKKSGSRTVQGSHAPIQRVQLLHVGTQLPRGHLLHVKSGLHTAQISKAGPELTGRSRSLEKRREKSAYPGVDQNIEPQPCGHTPAVAPGPPLSLSPVSYSVWRPRLIVFYQEQPRSVHIVVTRATARF